MQPSSALSCKAMDSSTFSLPACGEEKELGTKCRTEHGMGGDGGERSATVGLGPDIFLLSGEAGRGR